MFGERKLPPELKDLTGLFKTNPLFASVLSLFLLGLAGMPPLFGFFAKASLFQPLIAAGHWWILFWGLVASAIGLYYYIKPLTYMCQGHCSSPLVLPWSLKGLLGFALWELYWGLSFWGGSEFVEIRLFSKMNIL